MLELPSEIKEINTWLATVASNPQGQPLMRIVWSTDRFEDRKGVYNEFYGDVFTRTVVGILPRPKYPEIVDRFIFEKWYPPKLTYNPEIPATKDGDYICLYVYQNKQHEANPLFVIRRLTEIIVKELNKPKRSSMLIKSTDLQEHEDKMAREQRRDEDIIDVSPVLNALHMKEAVGYTKELEDKETK